MTLPVLPSMQGADSKPLTPKQRKFVSEYVTNGGKGESAAIEAGYSKSTARVQAYQILRKPNVLQAILNETAASMASAAPQALLNLRRLINARSEYVSLQASQDVLDRLGLRAPDKNDVRISGDIAVNIDLS
jgi:phage terminase small subunit